MKIRLYLQVIFYVICLMSCTKESVETDEYSFDSDGNIVLTNTSSSERSEAKFESIVCGHCWETSSIKKTNGATDEYIVGFLVHKFYIANGTCICYTFTDSEPVVYKQQVNTTYNELTGKLTDTNGNELLTIISINSDNSITAYDTNATPYKYTILTMRPMQDDDYATMDSKALSND